MIISAWVNILEELVTFSLSKEFSIIEPSQIWMFVMDTMSITTLPRHRPDLRIGLILTNMLIDHVETIA